MSVPRTEQTSINQQHRVTYIILGNLDNHIGILADSLPGLPLWSSSSQTNFTDAGGSEGLSISIEIR